MAFLRSKPLLIAPAIPLWAVVAFSGAEQLRGTTYFGAFLVLVTVVLLALVGYVAKQMMRARQARLSR